MKKALFLDRDGIINIERGTYTFLPEDFIIHPSCIEVLQDAIKKEYNIFIISNQSGIAKGIYTQEQVEKLHRNLHKKLKTNNINITKILYCPHHPDVGNCLCRKPKPILFEKIIHQYQINPLQSIMLGDKMRDIIPAIHLGIKGVCIDPNTDYTFLKHIL